MAKPIADSAPATPSTSKASTSPIMSSKETEKVTNNKLQPKSISSMLISICIKLALLIIIPNIPMANKKAPKNTTSVISSVI